MNRKANLTIAVRGSDGAVLRETIIRSLDPDHGHWGRVIEDVLAKKMTGNSIPDRGNSIGKCFVGRGSPGHFMRPKVASVAGIRAQGRAHWGAVKSPY